ncbi:MAG: SGNH/GDSL hydrolase family protein [Acidimicrobiaceae bacterium]|nr:SGNH/GDSL hydrolase family protein [Acidimicrobiaceae bacterium]
MTVVATVVCFGDSNTWGYSVERAADPVPRLVTEDRRVSVTARALGPDHVVIAEGLPGRTTVFDDPIEGEHLNGHRLLRACLETHKPVDCVVVVLGTNDLKSLYSASAWDIAQGAGRLLDVVAVSACGPDGGAPQALLVAPPPTRVTGLGAPFEDVLAGADARSRRFDAEFSAVAANRGVAYLNAGEVIESSPIDGVHWSPQAHRAIGQAIAASVKGLTK